MRKVVHLLIPVAYNDGTPVPQEVIDDIYAQIFVLSKGWNEQGIVRGAYEMKDGSMKVEWSRSVWIDLDEESEPLLKAAVSKFCRLLGQESMYYEVRDSMVQYIPPAPE